MSIEARLPDGTVLQFPDGTADAVIDRAVRNEIRQRGMSGAERAEEHMRTPEGRAQLERMRADRSASTPAAGEGRPAQAESVRTSQGVDYSLEAAQNRAPRRRRLEENLEESSGPVRDTLAFIGSTVNRQNREDYPQLYRNGRRLTAPEIAEIVTRSQSEIEGMSPDEATRHLFARPELRPESAPSVSRTRRAAPRYQIDPLNRDLEDPMIGGTRRERENLQDFGPARPLTDVQRDEIAREREIRRIRRERTQQGYYEGLPGFLRGIKEAGTSTLMTTAGGIVGAVVDNLGMEDTELARRARVERQVGSARMELADPGYEQGSVPYYIFNSTVAVGQMASALAIGATTRNPNATAAAVMGMQVFGQEYDERMRAGASPREALRDGAVYALFEAIPERIALGHIMGNGGKFGGSLLGRVARGTAAEAVQEDATEALQILYDAGVIHEEMSWGDVRQRLTDAGIIGGLTGGFVSGGHSIATGGEAGAERREALGELESMDFDPEGADSIARESFKPAPSGDVDPRLRPVEAFEGESELTQADRASPLPDDVIARGRSEIRRGQSRTGRQERDTGHRIAPDIYQALVEGGVPEPVAQGIASGVAAESNSDHTIVNQSSGAFGIGQWLGPRLAELRRRYGQNPTRQQQIEFLLWELRGGDHGGAAVLQSRNPDEALNNYITRFMRPAQGAETDGDLARGRSALRAAGVEGVGATAPTETAATTESQSVESFIESVLGPQNAALSDDAAALMNEALSGAEEQIAQAAQEQVERVSQDEPGLPPIPPPLQPDAAVEAPLPASPDMAQGVTAGQGILAPPSASSIPAPSAVPAETSPIPAAPAQAATSLPASPLLAEISQQQTEAVRAHIEANPDWESDPQAAAAATGVTPQQFGRALVALGYSSNETGGVTRPDGSTYEPDPSQVIQPPASSPARRPAFDVETYLPQLQAHVAGRGSLDRKAIAKKLDVTPAQADRVIGVLASRPNSGVFLSRAGKLRRQAVSRTPLDAIRFLRNEGGIRPEGIKVSKSAVGGARGHSLTKGRNWHLAAPGLINRNGMALDEAGQRLLEAGYFHNRNSDDRPTEDEVQQFIDGALTKRVYRLEDQEQVAGREEDAAYQEQRENADYQVRDFIEDLDLNLTPQEIEDAVDYMASGETLEIAVQRSLDDASARTLYDLADETGRDFYETVAESIYVGEVAEERGGSPEEGLLGPEGLEGDSGDRAAPGGEPAQDAGPQGAEQEVETRAGAATTVAPEGTDTTSATGPQPYTPNVENAALSATERAALERLLVSEKKGGEGWHRESSGAANVRALLDQGETRSEADEDLLDTAQRLAQRTQPKREFPELQDTGDNEADARALAKALIDAGFSTSGFGDNYKFGIGQSIDPKGPTRIEGKIQVELDRARMKFFTFGINQLQKKTPPAASRAEDLFESNVTPIEAARSTGYGAKNRLVTANRADELRTRLKEKLSGAQLNAGLDPELIALGTELSVFHIEAGARRFADFAKAIADDLGMALANLKPYLRGWYNGARDFMEDQGESVDGMDGPGAVKAAITMIEDSQPSEIRSKEGGDVSATGTDLESDRGRAAAEDGVREAPVSAERGQAGRSAGSRDGEAEGERGERPAREGSAPVDRPLPLGEPGDSGVRSGSPGTSERAAERGRSERGADSGESGLAAGRVPTAAVERTASDSPDIEAKRAEQRAANSIKVTFGDRANVGETLPFLRVAQQDDVAFVETRFAKPDGHGVLLTNGTGTGKTFSGGGAIARMVRAGQTEHLIVVPSQDIAESWKAALAELGVDSNLLISTEDAGKGVSITTYANFYQNQALADRDFDLITADESQKLSSNKDGETTSALTAFRALTKHPEGRFDLARMRLRKKWAPFDAIRDRWLTMPKKTRPGNWGALMTDAQTDALNALEVETKALAQSFSEARPKALFLSATPWSYVESIDYAEGYLFNYGKADPSTRQGGYGYNQPDPKQQFFITHFGYRMRYNKLTKPDAEVDAGVMERQFHEWLKGEGVLSGRALDVDADYDRKFVSVDDAVGNQIDQALDFLSSEDGGKFRPIYDLVSKKFDYLSRMRLLEAIKAQHAIPMIRAYHNAGRKVVVFHDYNEGGGFSPFVLNLDPEQTFTTYKDGKTITTKPYELYREFLARNPYVEKLDFSKFPAPLVTLTRAFPDAIIYNGTVPAKKRREGKEAFNKDGPGTPNLIIIQSAAGEYGISVHDTTGKHMRMTINLGMPVRPTTAIQEEGRTRRDGSMTDAGYRYLNTGTAWERWTFAGKIAERASTAENLALGNQARHLRQSFIDAFNDTQPFEVTEEDGKGGKEFDRALNTTTPFQQAKTFYFGQQKKARGRGGREGVDYFATPEPVGLKMVEFANIAFGEKALEPSAGHGAIARFFPDFADRTLVEPSSELLSRAALSSPGARTQGIRFEDLNVVNKYDAIVMNPPFGMGGKTAIEHLAKAARHLRNGGRIVAIIPEGPAADKRFEAWYDGSGAEGLFVVSSISLPPATFERAGTQVRSRIVVIDKQTDANVASRIQQSTRDLSGAESIKELFDRIENMSVPERLKPETEEKAGGTFTLADLGPTPAGDLAPTEKPAFETGETKHGKTGEDLFVAAMTERVDRETYDRILKRAKEHGGYYSSYRSNGAIPGFQFATEADRAAFIAAAGANRSSVQESAYPYNPTPASQRSDVARLESDRQQAWKERRAHMKSAWGVDLPETPPANFSDMPAAVRARAFAAEEERRIETAKGDEEALARLEASGGRMLTREEALQARIAQGPAITEGMTLDIRATVPGANGTPTPVVRRWTVRETGDYITTLDPAEGNPSPPSDVVTTDLMNAMQGGNAREAKPGAPKPERFSISEDMGDFDFDAAQPTRSMTQAQRAELEARSMQSKARRGGQVGLGDQEGGLFSNERDQGSLFLRAEGQPRVFDERVAGDLHKALKKMGLGDKLILNVVNNLFNDPRIAGQYQAGTVTVALEAAQNPKFTLRHEVIHALRDMGLFRADEWRALVKRAKADGRLMESVRRRYGGHALSEEEMVEEAVGDMFAAWRQGRTENGMVRDALARIREFFSAVYRAIRETGSEREIRRAAETVMGAIDRGEFGAREEALPWLLDQSRLSLTEDEEGSAATRQLLSDRQLDAIREKTDLWRTRLQDRMLPLLRAQQRIEAQSGERLPESLNPYLQEELMSGRVGSKLEKLHRDMVEPLFDQMKKEGLTLDEVETWLYARHAPERNARIAEINPDFEEGTGSGMTDEEAAAIMAEAESAGKTDALERMAGRVDTILRFAIATRVEAGLLSKEEAQVWAKRFEHYVPLRGMAEVDPEAGADRPMFGRGINVRGPESQRAFGRRSKARNIMAYTLLQAEEAIVRGGINQVGQAFYELARANPDSNFWTVDKINRKPAINRETGQVYYRSDHRLAAADAPYTVSLKIDGQEHRVTLNRNNAAAVRLAAAMRNLHGTELGSVMRLFGATNRFLSTVNTTLSPEFVITNAFRDLQTASINLQGVDVPGITRGVLKDYKSAMKGAMKGAFGKEDGEWGKWYREFVDEGGRVYFNRIEDLNELQRRIERQMTSAAGGMSAVRAGGAALFKFIENVNLGVENAIRLSAYKNARERGVSKAQAASLAKNLTVNFNRRGEWGTAANALYLFYNASVQGSARMILAMRSKRVRRVLYAAAATGFVLDMLNSLISDDDDDGESFYDKISDFDKSRNLIVMVPGGRGRYIKIPLPYGYNVFFGAGRAASEIARNPSFAQARNSGSHLLGTLVDSFNPIGGTNSLLNFIAPTVADPIVDLSRNRDFADRPIMPEQERHGPKIPESQRYWGTVSPHWRLVTDTLNRASGGDEVVPGYVDISPEALEHLGGVATGAAGNFFIDRVGGLVEKVVAGEALEANDLPLVRRVIGSPPRWYNKSAFYTRVDQIEQAAANVDSYRERGEEETATAYEEANQDILALKGAARAARRRMRSIRGDRGNLDRQLDLGEIDRAEWREQRRELQGQEDEAIDEFNSAYIEAIDRTRRVRP